MIERLDDVCMKMAIARSRDSHSESGKTSPNVGAVLTKDGRILGDACRGEREGRHAEFHLIDTLGGAAVGGSTLYTTLEPCTFRGLDSNKQLKKACVDHIIEARVSRVVIGMLDPNPYITGNGIMILRQHGIRVELFPADLMDQIEEINEDFLRQFGWSRYERLGDLFPTLNDLIGTWVLETHLDNGTMIIDEVYIQRRAGGRLYGLQINQNTNIQSWFYMTYIDNGVFNYTFRSKLGGAQLDHGTGVVIFNDFNGTGYGLARGVVVGGTPHFLRFQLRRGDS